MGVYFLLAIIYLFVGILVSRLAFLYSDISIIDKEGVALAILMWPLLILAIIIDLIAKWVLK